MTADVDEGFQEIFDRSFEHAAEVATRILGPGVGEDAAIEAYARALARWDKVRGLPNLDQRLLAESVVVAVDRARKQKRQPTFEAEGTGPTPAKVQAALAGMSAAEGRVIVLRHIAGLEGGEVADALGMDQGKVDALEARGLATLQDRMQGGTWA